MTKLPQRWVTYVGERFGWHVCDIYDGDEWLCQVRFNPRRHSFHTLSLPEAQLPDDIKALHTYDDWRAFVKNKVVPKS